MTESTRTRDLEAEIDKLTGELVAVRTIVAILACDATRDQVKSMAQAALMFRDAPTPLILNDAQRTVFLGNMTNAIGVIQAAQRHSFRGGLHGLKTWLASGLASMRRAVFGCGY